MILYVTILETIDEKKDAEVLEEHIGYLNQKLEEGILIAKGPFTDHTGGLMIYKADSIDEARKLIEADPAVRDKTREIALLKEWKSTIEV